VAVASAVGAPGNPAWYYNLIAHPDVRLQDGAEVRFLRARAQASSPGRRPHRPGCHLGASVSSLDECSQTADTRLAPLQRTMLLRTNQTGRSY
jgi:hypothetical protein